MTKPPAETGTGFDTKDILPALWKASSQWKGKYYGVPSNSAVMMMVYRKDLFEDPGEQAAFKASTAMTSARPRPGSSTGTRPSSSPGRGRDARGQPFTGTSRASR